MPDSKYKGTLFRVSANGPGDLGSMPGRVIPKVQNWYLMPSCLTLSIIRYGSRVKWVNPAKGVGPFPTPRSSSYRKGSLRDTLDYGRQLYLLIRDNIYYYFSLILLFSHCFLTFMQMTMLSLTNNLPWYNLYTLYKCFWGLEQMKAFIG